MQENATPAEYPLRDCVSNPFSINKLLIKHQIWCIMTTEKCNQSSGYAKRVVLDNMPAIAQGMLFFIVKIKKNATLPK